MPTPPVSTAAVGGDELLHQQRNQADDGTLVLIEPPRPVPLDAVRDVPELVRRLVRLHRHARGRHRWTCYERAKSYISAACGAHGPPPLFDRDKYHAALDAYMKGVRL